MVERRRGSAARPARAPRRTGRRRRASRRPAARTAPGLGTARSVGRPCRAARGSGGPTSSDSRTPAPAARATCRPDARIATPSEAPVTRTTPTSAPSTIRIETPIGPTSPFRPIRAYAPTRPPCCSAALVSVRREREHERRRGTPPPRCAAAAGASAGCAGRSRRRRRRAAAAPPPPARPIDEVQRGVDLEAHHAPVPAQVLDEAQERAQRKQAASDEVGALLARRTTRRPFPPGGRVAGGGARAPSLRAGASGATSCSRRCSGHRGGVRRRPPLPLHAARMQRSDGQVRPRRLFGSGESPATEACGAASAISG